MVRDETEDGMSGRKATRSLAGLIVMGFFAIFTWGFSYNLLKRNGFTEPTAQIMGITLGLIAIIAVEGVTRLRLRRIQNQETRSMD